MQFYFPLLYPRYLTHLVLCDTRSAGVDTNRCNNNGASPLYYASSNGHEKIVQLLLDRRVNIDQSDSEGSTAFSAACRQGHRRIAEMLADAGADIFAQTINGYSVDEDAEGECLEWLNQVMSVPSYTPRLVAALQRMAWATFMISTNRRMHTLVPDLVELVATYVPIRVPWAFALDNVQS